MFREKKDFLQSWIGVGILHIINAIRKQENLVVTTILPPDLYIQFLWFKTLDSDP